MSRAGSALLLALALGCGPADRAPDAERAAEVERVFAALGVGSSLHGWAELAVADLAQFQPALERETFDLVVLAAREAYRGDALRAAVVDHLARAYEGEPMGRILAWYETEVGRAVAAATQAAADSEATLRDLPEFLARYEGSTPPPERLALVQRYNAAARSSALGVALMLGVSRANLQAISLLLPADQQLGADEIDRRLDDAREQLTRTLDQQGVVTSMFLFRNLTAEQLEAHVAFLEGAAFQWYVGHIGEAVDAALAVAATDLRVKTELIAAGD